MSEINPQANTPNVPSFEGRDMAIALSEAHFKATAAHATDEDKENFSRLLAEANTTSQPQTRTQVTEIVESHDYPEDGSDSALVTSRDVASWTEERRQAMLEGIQSVRKQKD